jgi:hypothetical protein
MRFQQQTAAESYQEEHSAMSRSPGFSGATSTPTKQETVIVSGVKIPAAFLLLPCTLLRLLLLHSMLIDNDTASVHPRDA